MISGLLKLIPVSVSLGLASLSFVGGPGSEVRAQAPVDYAKVDLIFRNNDCIDCHDDSPQAASKLSLTTYEGLMDGGRRGDAIEAGKSDDSLLMKLVSHRGAPRMPPGGVGLKDEEVATLKQWIDEGAQNSPYGEALSNYYTAKKQSKWTDALKACDQIEGIKIEGVPTADIAARCRMPIMEQTKDESGFYKAAARLVEAKPIDVGVMNELAWTIVDPKGWIQKRDLALAEQGANRAVEGSGRKSGAVLDTLAWVYFLQGDKAKAIATEKEAMTCRDAQGATLDSLKDSMKAFGG